MPLATKPERCPHCGEVLHPRTDPADLAKTLLIQTPPSVWAQYRADGYTIGEAIKEEWSYA